MSLQDARETNVMALNKAWHEVWDFQRSWLGIKYPPTGKDEPFRFFVDLNGATLDALNFEKISSLLYFAHLDTTFTANRIDIALDFYVQTPRLFAHDWEYFIEDALLYGYKKIRPITNSGSSDGNTVYIGSREPTRFLRIYDNCRPGNKVWTQALWASPSGNFTDSKGCFILAFSQDVPTLLPKVEYNPFFPEQFVKSRAISYYLVNGDRYRGLQDNDWKKLESVSGWDKGYWRTEQTGSECRGWRLGWSRKIK